jgi:GTP-binding protein EngB required for normal cell division
MNLGTYERHKFALAEILRSAVATVSPAKSDLRERGQVLAERLAADRFNLVVVGRFNRGKTSLMNAIIGTDRLPTGIVPITSVITSIAYGSKEETILKYENSLLHQSVPIEALPQFITQAGNPGNVRRIRAAEIRLPAEILRRGFYFIDTPGIGSAIAENTATTEEFLPEADALVLVTGYESPISEEELHVLKVACSLGRKVFVVINKQDTVPTSDREQICTYVSNRLQDAFSHFAPELFSTSALEGLKAKQAHDKALLAQSGIERFEDALVCFLLDEKRERFLIAMCDRTAELLRDIPVVTETAVLLHKLNNLQKLLASSGGSEPSVASNSAQKAYNLHRIGSCEICASVREWLWNFICRYQYDLITNPLTQDDFAQRKGFCPFHTWEYEAVASSYGICNAYPDLLDSLAPQLRKLASSEETNPVHFAAELGKLQTSHANCAMCNEREKAERFAIGRVTERLTDATEPIIPELCLPHLLLVVEQIKNPDLIKRCIDRHGELLNRLSEDLQRHALKIDGASRHRVTDEETAAARRALMAVVGARNVNFDLVSRLSSAGGDQTKNETTAQQAENR